MACAGSSSSSTSRSPGSWRLTRLLGLLVGHCLSLSRPWSVCHVTHMFVHLAVIPGPSPTPTPSASLLLWPEWHTEPWSPCSRLCGSGRVRHRTVTCVWQSHAGSVPAVLADCSALTAYKPSEVDVCPDLECPILFWRPPAKWSPCSLPCISPSEQAGECVSYVDTTVPPCRSHGRALDIDAHRSFRNLSSVGVDTKSHTIPSTHNQPPRSPRLADLSPVSLLLSS
jgi:hypothetical protein